MSTFPSHIMISSPMESHWICVQHSIMVLSIFSSVLTYLGIFLTWYRFVYLVTLSLSGMVSMASLILFFHPSPRFALLYVTINMIDWIGKGSTIIDLVMLRTDISSNCLHHEMRSSPSCSCTPDMCRLILLNSSSGIVFLFIAILLECFLAILAIYLFIFLRRHREALLQATNVKSQLYGTFYEESGSYDESYESIF